MIVKICLIILLCVSLVRLQDNNIERICGSCGDIVNEYCCRYHQKCCDYLNPNGCPAPSSPEARTSCRRPVSCRSNADCPIFKHCCDTSVCGATCMKPTFPGYRY